MLVRYINRRMYDRGPGRGIYLTVPQMKERIIGGETITDARSNQDITAQILAQIVLKDVRAGEGPGAEQLRAFIATYRRHHNGR